MSVYNDILKEGFKFRRDTRLEYGITTVWLQDVYFGFEAAVTGIPHQNSVLEDSEVRRLLDDMRTARKRFCDMVAPEVERVYATRTSKCLFFLVRRDKQTLTLGPGGIAKIVKSMTPEQWARVREASEGKDPYVDRLISKLEGLA